MTPRMRTDLTLGLLAGAAQMLGELEHFQQFYFQGLHELLMDVIRQWPRMPLKNRRATVRYMFQSTPPRGGRRMGRPY